MATYHITATHSVEQCGYGDPRKSKYLLASLKNINILEKKWKCIMKHYSWNIAGHTCYMLIEANSHYSLNMFVLEILGGVGGVRSDYTIVPVVTRNEMLPNKSE